MKNTNQFSRLIIGVLLIVVEGCAPTMYRETYNERLLRHADEEVKAIFFTPDPISSSLHEDKGERSRK